MRNDHKGRITHDGALGLDTFYASGAHGHEVRANGTGSTLTRGYYATTDLTGSIGPFTCRKAAARAGHYAYRGAYQASLT